MKAMAFARSPDRVDLLDTGKGEIAQMKGGG